MARRGPAGPSGGASRPGPADGGGRVAAPHSSRFTSDLARVSCGERKSPLVVKASAVTGSRLLPAHARASPAAHRGFVPAYECRRRGEAWPLPPLRSRSALPGGRSAAGDRARRRRRARPGAGTCHGGVVDSGDGHLGAADGIGVSQACCHRWEPSRAPADGEEWRGVSLWHACGTRNVASVRPPSARAGDAH